MTIPRITIENIESFRGGLSIRPGQLTDDIWSVFERAEFDRSPNAQIIPISQIISTKNQLEDPKFLRGEKADPRQTAFDRMLKASKGELTRRAPINVEKTSAGFFEVLDGNATVQVLMFAGWKNVPALVSV